MLTALRETGLQLAILSNGTPKMLSAAADTAGIAAMFDAILSVEAVGVFKPHRKVYQMVADRFGTDPAEVAFISSNGWDACSAAAFGFHAIWVNRTGAPLDRLQAKPAQIINDLSALPALLARPVSL